MTKRLLLLNGLAVLGVVLHHASGYGFRAMFFWTDVYRPVTVPNYDQVGTATFYAIVLLQQIDAFTLPAFMFVSGFFAAFMLSGKKRYSVATTRVKNLLIPFAIWTLIYYLLLNRRLPGSLDDILSRYYYIPLLCQYYLLAPLIIPAVKTRWKLLLGVTAVLEIIENSLQYLGVMNIDPASVALITRLTPKWLTPNLLFWFVLGAVASVHRQQFVAWLSRIRHRLPTTALILIVLSMVEYVVIAHLTDNQWLGPYFGGLSRSVYALVFILAFLAYDEVDLPFQKEMSSLGSKSLGVYLAHSVVMYIGAVAMYRAAPWMLGNQILYQGTLIVVGLAVPILLMTLVARTPMRRGYRYLFG
ncbi:MAG TPA: acyltransferase [Candidatus Sulfomarinibacteraceae bacterium]|nr:acyltransferase [Candidatus Sulfomarinibacteraceae bacterium]